MKKVSQQRSRSSHQNAPSWPKHWRIAVGQHAIAEVFKVRPEKIKRLWLVKDWERRQELRELEKTAQSLRIQIESKSSIELDKLARSHQGAAVFVDGGPSIDWESLKEKKVARLLLLDGVEDPHNLGAILRTAWLMGVDGMLLPQDRAVGLTPAVHKVAAGGAEHVPIESHVNFSNIMEDLKKMGFWILALGAESKSSLHNLKLPEKILWVLGSEDKGIRGTTSRHCDEVVGIPQASNAASYNVSVAAAIALSETCRQHAFLGSEQDK